MNRGLGYFYNTKHLAVPVRIRVAPIKTFKNTIRAVIKMATKKISFTGGYGARYGASVKQKLVNAIKKMKSWQKCPYCSKKRVKRISYGIWHCRACDSKFAGKAYEV